MALPVAGASAQRSVMKKVSLVALIACLSLTAQAFTVIRFPNQKFRITYSNFKLFEVEEVDHEREKEMREHIEAALSPLKGFSASRISELLGPERELTDEYFLPSYYFAGLTLSNPQVNGDPVFHFFPIKDFGGLVVLQMSGNPKISGGAIYFRKDKVTDEEALTEETVNTVLKFINDRVTKTEQGATGKGLQPSPAL